MSPHSRHRRYGRHGSRGSASVWAILIIAGAFTALLGLVVDGGRVLDARIAAARAAGQAARAGADALSSAGVRNGQSDGQGTVDAPAAVARAQRYLTDAGLTGTVSVTPTRVSVTVTGRSGTQILGIFGITSFPIQETESAEPITAETRP